jgi:hypothetical protein
MSTDSFKIEAYLPKHSNVTDIATGKAFLYEPGKGSLFQQEENGGAYGNVQGAKGVARF